MQTIKYDTYIVLDLPETTSEYIANIRTLFKDSFRMALPTEITIAGSSGLGIIDSNQSLQDVIDSVEQIASKTKPINASFREVSRFPNTDLFFLSLKDEGPFLDLHQSFLNSGIRFLENPFPYKPHCTLCSRPLSEQEIHDLTSIKDFHPFALDSLSLYSIKIDEELRVEVQLLYTTVLSGGDEANL